jgi:hypothetical protein
LLGVRVQNGQLNSKKSLHGLKKVAAEGGKAGEAATATLADWHTNMQVCLL